MSQVKETPLMAQYNAIKAQHQDAILFFRMGDFFEMFNEDAKIGAKVLGITLTSRGHGKTGEVPLAGFPHHAMEGYLAKMLKAGYRVAICEQTEDPKLAKGIVKRDVIQIVTPGTLVEENMLEARRNNYLVSVVCQENYCGLASLDVSTGEFNLTELPVSQLSEEIQAISPAEILLDETQKSDVQALLSKVQFNIIYTPRDSWIFHYDYGRETLVRHFKTNSLKGFGCEDFHLGIAAAGAILTYVQETQKTDLSYIRKLKPYSDADYMMLDGATRKNLEITSSMSGHGKEGTLLSILDRTKTAMGGRMLVSWIQRPLKNYQRIAERLDAVSALMESQDVQQNLFEIFKKIGDLERLIARVEARRANPRDVSVLARGLHQIPEIQEIAGKLESPFVQTLIQQLDPCEALCGIVANALVEEPPAMLGKGIVIREGYDAELDELRELTFSGKDWIAKLQAKEREKTGIPSLKIGYNRVFGYYLEATKAHLEKVPDEWIRKQTLVNAERFITPELKEMEEKILKAEERIEILERQLFENLREETAAYGEKIQNNAQAVGQLDALLSFAVCAIQNKYIQPDIHTGDEINIEDGRHPVVEQLLPSGEPFIANHTQIDNQEQQVLIITGPNMAGKSTYIRQVGLIVLLAQIGCYVPANKARIGLVDRIFTRVGAQDNLAGGESTFLVEMNETANILNNATDMSLILLDEIGRGTSTFDGLSIAWAVAEFLHNHSGVQSKTLFATHYHELTELERILPRVKNYNVAVKEWKDHIVFLRKILPGGCDHSYGIQVARLAGLPKEIIVRAKEILHNLEANELTPNELPKLALGDHAPIWNSSDQLNIFNAQDSEIKKAFDCIDINDLTPLEALQKLNDLKNLVDSLYLKE